MKKVSIIGSGNVGVNSAFFLAETAVANVMLVDVLPGISTGKALDLMEAGPIRHYRTRIAGSDDIAAIEGSDVVVLAAGIVRTPGQNRGENYRDNEGIVKGIAGQVARLAPEAVVLVITSPVEGMLKVFLDESGFDRHRAFGSGTRLDSTRLASFVAEALNISPLDVTGMVIGSHTTRMVPVPEFTRVSGIPITELMTPEQIDKVIADTREAGTLIIELAKRHSAYYAPSAVVTEIVEAICHDTKKVLPVSVLLKGEYGIHDLPLSVPCKVGAAGIEEILAVDLPDEVMEAFRDSSVPVRGWLKSTQEGAKR
jgi:malate dehydrogenase